MSRPPRVAEWLLARSLPGDDREVVLGDLCEEFAQRAGLHGPAAARRWYWRQLRRSFLINLLRLVSPQTRRGEGGRLVFPGGSLQDLRYAVRALFKARAFSIVVW